MITWTDPYHVPFDLKAKRFSVVESLIFFSLTGRPGQLARTSTNTTGPEINDHVSLQWSSYEQSQGSNLRL
jgi:hypothetical protein